jgi:hypothetical protein
VHAKITRESAGMDYCEIHRSASASTVAGVCLRCALEVKSRRESHNRNKRSANRRAVYAALYARIAR